MLVHENNTLKSHQIDTLKKRKIDAGTRTASEEANMSSSKRQRLSGLHPPPSKNIQHENKEGKNKDGTECVERACSANYTNKATAFGMATLVELVVEKPSTQLQQLSIRPTPTDRSSAATTAGTEYLVEELVSQLQLLSIHPAPKDHFLAAETTPKEASVEELASQYQQLQLSFRLTPTNHRTTSHDQLALRRFKTALNDDVPLEGFLENFDRNIREDFHEMGISAADDITLRTRKTTFDDMTLHEALECFDRNISNGLSEVAAWFCNTACLIPCHSPCNVPAPIKFN
jgi:hypothetical protein